MSVFHGSLAIGDSHTAMSPSTTPSFLGRHLQVMITGTLKCRQVSTALQNIMGFYWLLETE
jgi:hypothetical protein